MQQLAKYIEPTENIARPSHLISICDQFHPERQMVEDFLTQNYSLAFGGILSTHYPIIMSVRNAENELGVNEFPTNGDTT